jgi:DNA polymerase-1
VYAAEDVAVLPAIVRMQQKRLKDAGLLDIARLEFAVLPALAEAHVWGIRIDVDRWRTFIAHVAAEAKAVEAELVAELTPYLDRYRQDKEAGLAEEYQAAFAQREAAKAYREAEAERARQAALEQGMSKGAARDVFNAVKKAIPLPPAPPKPDAGSGPINLESTEQVGRALLEMEVPLPCNEAGKPTTKKEVMLALVDSGEYPIVDRFMEWREMNKLVSTYGEIVNLVDAANRLHPVFNQLVSTGRMSAKEPNVQQVPNTERGHELRLCFIAREGYKLVATDYSAIEMRILAEVTGEPLLLWSIEKGLDPHSMTAVRMFPEVQGALGVQAVEIDALLNRAKQDPEALEQLKTWLAAVKDEHGHYRKVAKMINFGVAYGLSPQGLSSKLRIPLPDAKRYINDYFATNQHIDRWLKTYGSKGLTRLESRTILGRPRYFRLPKREECPQKWMYEAGLRRIKRQVCNHVIQGTSADITKLAVVLLRQAIADGGWDAKMLLFVHDEVVLEVREDQAEAVAELMRAKMVEAAKRILAVVQIDAVAEIETYWKH